MLADLHRERPGGRDEPRLRGAVDHAAAQRLVRLHGGDEDDAAPSPGAERRDRELRAGQGALQVDVEDPVDVVLGHLLEVGVQPDGRVGDHHVETAERAHGVVDEALDVLTPPDVAERGDALGARLAHEAERLVEPVAR